MKIQRLTQLIFQEEFNLYFYRIIFQNKRMKKVYLFSIVLLFNLNLLLAQEGKVYVSETGKKYHTKNCSAAKTGKTGLLAGEAKKQGYTACGVCKPDQKSLAAPSKKGSGKK